MFFTLQIIQWGFLVAFDIIGLVLICQESKVWGDKASQRASDGKSQRQDCSGRLLLPLTWHCSTALACVTPCVTPYWEVNPHGASSPK